MSAFERPSRRRITGPVRLLPSMITILALCAGLSAVKFALEDDLGVALAMVGAAAVLDMLDGRIARLLDATSKMGGELDSLADAISFGVAPALVLYVALLDDNSAGWIIALIYVVSIVLRLARFNTLTADTNRPSYTQEYFVGVPAPAGALIALLPIALFCEFGEGWWSSFAAVATWTVFSAALIVSRIPTLAMKTMAVPPQAAAGLLVLVALAAALLVTYPLILLIVLDVLYLLHIPFAVRSQRWVAARPQHWESKPSERRAERRATRSEGARRSVARLGLRRPGSR